MILSFLNLWPSSSSSPSSTVRSCVADELVRTVFTTLTGHGHLHFTRRGAPAAAAPSGRSASNVHNSPTQSTPGLSAQFLRTHHRRVRRGSSSYAAGFSGIRCASLASASTYAFVAAAAGQRDDGARCRGDGGLDCFDVVVLRRGRCRGAELRERAAPRGSTPGADGHGCSLQLA